MIRHRFLGVLFALSLATLLVPEPAHAGNPGQEANAIVSAARRSLDRFLVDPEMQGFRAQLANAKAVLLVPKRIRVGLIFGGSGGAGVLLARDATTGDWSQPVFYNLGGGSFGLQVGGERSEVALLILTDRGLDAFLSPRFQLGAEAAVAAGPVGAGTGETAGADVLTFVRSKGLYAGASFEGTAIRPARERNRAFYGRPATPADILIRRAVTNETADGLREDLARAMSTPPHPAIP